MKKSKTLSNYYKVKVLAITYNKFAINQKLNDNLELKNIYINPKFRFFYKTILNKILLKKIISQNPADIYECHDPSTIFGGVFAKNKFDSKTIYDSHELWRDIEGKKENIFKTIYSKILGRLQFNLEKKYISDYDCVVVVNKSILEIYEEIYKLKKIEYICNYSNLDEFKEIPNRSNTIVFIGKNRPQVESKLILAARALKLKPVVMGFLGKYKEIDYRGKLKKEEYTKELRKQKIGLNFYLADSKSLFYSLPNKIFQYIQAEIPIISLNLPEQKFIVDEGFGEIFDGSEEDFLNKLEIILNKKNYNKYIMNLRRKKYNYSWENQEDKLIEIYRSLC